jgi:cold shock CspA family protein
MAFVAKAKGIVTYFDPYDGYGYIVPEGKKSDEAVAFRYDVIDDSQMVQAVRANELVEFDTDDEDNPRVATKVARVKEPAKKAAEKKSVKKTAAKKTATAAKKTATAAKKTAAKKRGTTR